MKKIGIFYGSTTGYTADVASRIAKAIGLNSTDVFDVAFTAPSTLGEYETILLGSSTWGSGDIQEDFADFLDGIESLDLKGHRIGVFGCGDKTMAGTFGGALRKIYDRMQPTGAEFIGAFNLDGYGVDSSAADLDGRPVGLLIDEVNHADLTDARIAAWTKSIAKA